MGVGNIGRSAVRTDQSANPAIIALARGRSGYGHISSGISVRNGDGIQSNQATDRHAAGCCGIHGDITRGVDICEYGSLIPTDQPSDIRAVGRRDISVGVGTADGAGEGLPHQPADGISGTRDIDYHDTGHAGMGIRDGAEIGPDQAADG